MIYYNKSYVNGLSFSLSFSPKIPDCTVLPLLVMTWNDTIPAWWDDVKWMAQQPQHMIILSLLYSDLSPFQLRESSLQLPFVISQLPASLLLHVGDHYLVKIRLARTPARSAVAVSLMGNLPSRSTTAQRHWTKGWLTSAVRQHEISSHYRQARRMSDNVIFIHWLFLEVFI